MISGARQEKFDFFFNRRFPFFSSPHSLRVSLNANMVKYTSTFKDEVLREYCPDIRGHSFRCLARRFGIKGGASTLSRWYHRWNGNPLSLRRKSGSGRKFLLTPLQVQRYILRPIERKNKKHQAVQYGQLQESLQQQVGHAVSVRTIRRYGKETAGCHGKTTIARTPMERKIKIYILNFSIYYACGKPYLLKLCFSC